MPLKHLCNFWRTSEVPLINCEISLFLPCSVNFATSAPTKAAIFVITGKKLYIPAVRFSTQNNSNVLLLLKSEFKRKIIWNKYQSKTLAYKCQNKYSDYLVDSSF